MCLLVGKMIIFFYSLNSKIKRLQLAQKTAANLFNNFQLTGNDRTHLLFNRNSECINAFSLPE